MMMMVVIMIILIMMIMMMMTMIIILTLIITVCMGHYTGDIDDANTIPVFASRLKGLAIGAWKSFIESLSAPDIEDIVEAFSKQDGFTPGQVRHLD